MDASVSSDRAQGIAAFESAARAIAGTENVRAATSDDRVSGIQPQIVVAPGSEQQLAQVLKTANETGLGVIPRGGGTKLAWGNPPQRADVILSTARLNGIIEHAHSDLTVTVEAGCTLQQLAETLAKENQRLALDVLWPSRATVGGILSTNDSGALRLRFGSLRDLVIGITLALPDGTLAKSGGKVVKNVAGYDLPKLATGALGTLGVITQATFRLHPMPKDTRTVSCLARDPRDAQRLILAIQDSKLAHSALQIRFVESTQPQIDLLFEATDAGCAAQAEQLKAILASATVIESGPSTWNARQDLYLEETANPDAALLAKLSVLPVQIAGAYEVLTQLAGANRTRFGVVFYAIGIGTIYLSGAHADLTAVLQDLRGKIESVGGSVVVAHRPEAMPKLDAWGNAGDAVELMRAVKRQFDPKATLNPGRFVGGI
ncbi:MAG TPA: FAD-binding oxidoreductase [Candidatus Sulfotelmatobacter sp.]|nr:FAD-binding oxidoreductase [Candidatus Sulfotelmatobacter sp.]